MTNPITQERLDEIRAREAKATPGPWAPDSYNAIRGLTQMVVAAARTAADAAYIADRQMVPDLLAALTAETARREEAERERDRVAEINADHCRSVNTLLFDNARRDDARSAAEATIARLRAALEKTRAFLKEWDSGNDHDGTGWFYSEFEEQDRLLATALASAPEPGTSTDFRTIAEELAGALEPLEVFGNVLLPSDPGDDSIWPKTPDETEFQLGASRMPGWTISAGTFRAIARALARYRAIVEE